MLEYFLAEYSSIRMREASTETKEERREERVARFDASDAFRSQNGNHAQRACHPRDPSHRRVARLSPAALDYNLVKDLGPFLPSPV